MSAFLFNGRLFLRHYLGNNILHGLKNKQTKTVDTMQQRAQELYRRNKQRMRKLQVNGLGPQLNRRMGNIPV